MFYHFKPGKGSSASGPPADKAATLIFAKAIGAQRRLARWLGARYDHMPAVRRRALWLSLTIAWVSASSTLIYNGISGSSALTGGMIFIPGKHAPGPVSAGSAGAGKLLDKYLDSLQNAFIEDSARSANQKSQDYENSDTSATGRSKP